jgi:thymidylate kinase
MQEVSSLPLRPMAMSFSTFLAALFEALGREGVCFCVLRNYEGFPDQNVGNDLDFLIAPSDLPEAIHILRSIPGVRIVGYTERPYIASVFLEGISATAGCRSFQVDFFLSLSWKGLPYLPVDTVLHALVPRQAGALNFFVPSPVHEAITSLLTSLIVSGWLKEKYFPKVQRIFANDRSEVVAALMPQFGSKNATRLVNSVIDGDRRKIMDNIRPLRASLALSSLRHRPICSVAAILRHCAQEFSGRYSPKTFETIYVLGTNGSGKSILIESLIPILQASAKVVEKRPFKLRLPLERGPQEVAVSATSHANAPRGRFVSMAMIVLWLLEEWISQFIGKKNLTLRVCDSCYHDLLIDPQRYRYGGPMWFARLIGKLFPSPDLWVLLDTSAEVLQSKSQQFPSEETVRQREAHRAFVKTRKRYVILDASQSIDCITENAYAAIIDTLAQRVDRKLKNRF